MKLKTVITLGPKSNEAEVIDRLLTVADRFRLNGSHLKPESLRHWLQKIFKVMDRRGKKIPIILDLQGGKYRIGTYPSVTKLPDHLRLVHGQQSCSTDIIPVPDLDFFSQIKVGDVVSLHDYQIRLLVLEKSPSYCLATVQANGPLSAFQGINILNHPQQACKLGVNDDSLLAVAKQFPILQVAFSFVYDGSETKLLKNLSASHLIAKIERLEAFDFLPQIATQFDEIWLCRGDLTAQVGLNQLGHYQQRFSEFINSEKNRDKPCMLAGGVLGQMVYANLPSRSEIVHLHDIQRLGYHGFVLSDETAIGVDPRAVADFLEQMQ